MLSRLLLTALVLNLISPDARAQGIPTSGAVGWYNGDWKAGVPGMASWHISESRFARVYDDFVTPEGGWTIVGVFAHVSMTPGTVTEAAWEIRSGLSEGNGGTVVASGRNPALLTRTATVGNGSYVFLIQVTGLSIQLAPGRYWLSVAPVSTDTHTFQCATLGANAVGEPAGMNGRAYIDMPPSFHFTTATTTGGGGTSGDFSLGVVLSAPPVPRDTAWRTNLKTLAQQMPALHSAPFPGATVDEFQQELAELSDAVSHLSEAEVRTGLQAVVASVGDPHTDVIWPSPSPFSWLPLSFYWFDDGIYITAASEQYQGLLGGKVTTVGESSIEDATEKLTTLTPHDNDSWLKYVITANKLGNADFLYGTGVAHTAGPARVQVQTPAGESVSADVPAFDQTLMPPMIPVYQGPLPLYRLHPEKHYWATLIDNGGTIYFQYNSCSEDPKQPSQEFFAQLEETMASETVRRLIVDLRNNSGGTTTILNPWIERLQWTRFNQPGRLYVIVGRATYSAAMEAANRFRDQTVAVFVGEPTGGKPQFLLRRGDFELPYFGIRVSYSNGVERANDPGDSLRPDIRVGVTFADYMNGVDPALDAILRIAVPAWE